MRAEVVRCAVLTCPHWPVLAAGMSLDQAVIVLRANRVVARSPRAGSDGVEVGMRRRQAQARCPSATLLADDPERDGRSFARVATAIGELVPRFEVGQAGTATFLARGPARYFGGEAAMAARVHAAADGALGSGDGVAQPGVAGAFGVGVADGRFAAELAARLAWQRGTAVIIPPGRAETARFLAPLPSRALATVAGLSGSFVELLARLGIGALGQLAELEAAAMLARFGTEGHFAHALASGDDPRHPACSEPPLGRAVEQCFEQPLAHTDALLFAARRVAEAMSATLAADGQACTRIAIVVETEHGERSERQWYRPEGLTAAAVIERLRWQLDAWIAAETLTAGITMLRLDPIEVRGDDGVQQGLWGGRREEDEWAARAVARLASMLGEERVVVPLAQPGRLPDELYRWVPASTVDLFGEERLTAVSGPWPGRGRLPQPTVVHRPPLATEVLDGDGLTVGVNGRGAVSAAPASVLLAGQRARVDDWAGPWPVDQRWWDPAGQRRVARFQLLVGRRLLEVYVERGRWWLSGEHA